jgi:predicted ATPase/DNA-binding SARP family transcriptional activator
LLTTSYGKIDRVRIGMLGSLEVRDDNGAAVYVSGARLRALLISLALVPGRTVSRDQLVDMIWGDGPPAGAANALQALVSRLRRAWPEAVIEADPAGYRLVIDPNSVDVTLFERLLAAGRALLHNEPAQASQRLGEALALWRGPALQDVATLEYFQAPITRLEELRLSATEDRVEALLQLGRGSELITELTVLVTEHRLRERLVGALMQALSDAGRQAEALAVYERTRQALADELGVDPSPQLSALHTEILRGRSGPVRARRVDAARRTNLRAGLTSFVGRDSDVAEVVDLMGEYRLTTITGAGGVGKTRLAVEASQEMVDEMSDGVWLVELAPVTDGADLPAAVLTAMDLRAQPLVGREGMQDAADRLISALSGRRTLLVLDNCEHLIEAAAAMTDRLLGECPGLRVLATSREPLAITGEAIWLLGPLALPPPGSDDADVLQFDAVRLLVDRARAVRPGLVVGNDNAQTVGRICRVLDGIPLAIELAAARLRTMTVAQLAEGLDDRFQLLTRGDRTAAPRHQTLRAVVDWSWELTSNSEKVLLRRLGVFIRGATPAAVQRVCARDTIAADRGPDLLARLVDKTLLSVDEDEGPRYRMLETIREYALERLDEAGEWEDIRSAHTQHFVELAETAEPHLRGAEQLTWLRRLESDHDNLNAALRGAIAAGDAQTAVRFVAAAGWYWWLAGHKSEGIELATDALAVPGEADVEAHATACAMVAFFSSAGLGDLKQVEPWIRRATRLAEGLDHPGPLLRYMVGMGKLFQTGRKAASVTDAMQSLIADTDPWVRAATRLSRVRMLGAADAEADIEQALVEYRSIGERWGMSYALLSLADLAARRGDLARALDYNDRALVVIAELGNVEDLVLIRAKQAQLYWLVGDSVSLEDEMARAESEAQRAGWPDAVAGIAFAKGELARWSGDDAEARLQLTHAQATLQAIGIDPVFRAMILDSLGYLDATDGALESAGARRSEALAIALDSGDPALVGQVFVGIADQAARRGHPSLAVQLLAASEKVSGGPDRSRPDGARVETAARSALGEASFNKEMRVARKELARTSRDELATAAAVRELTTSALNT